MFTEILCQLINYCTSQPKQKNNFLFIALKLYINDTIDYFGSKLSHLLARYCKPSKKLQIIQNISRRMMFYFQTFGFLSYKIHLKLFQVLLFLYILNINNLNMRTHKKLSMVLSQLVESILQHRIGTLPSFQQHSKIIRNSIETNLWQNLRKQKQVSLDLLEDLIHRQCFGIKNKLINEFKALNQKQNSIKVVFKIIEKANSKVMEVQAWIIKFSKTNLWPKTPQTNNIENRYILNVVQEILRGLKAQPLLGILIKNPQHSKKYILDYQIQLSHIFVQLSIINYSNSWEKKCFIENFEVRVQCYFSSLDFLYTSNKRNESYQEQEIQILSEQPINKKQSISTQQSHRKNSCLQFYDAQLDITILSSEQEPRERSLSWPENTTKKQIEQDEDSFQLLIEEKQIPFSIRDKQFFNQNTNQFVTLDKLFNQIQFQ